MAAEAAASRLFATDLDLEFLLEQVERKGVVEVLTMHRVQHRGGGLARELLCRSFERGGGRGVDRGDTLSVLGRAIVDTQVWSQELELFAFSNLQ